MKSLEASENWNNCVTWNLGRIKMVETHVGIGIDTQSLKSELMILAKLPVLVKVPFDFTLVEKKFKNKTTNINTIIDCTLTKNFPKGSMG
jgi:hypothetical protein